MRSLLHNHPGLLGALIGLAASALLVDLELTTSEEERVHAPAISVEATPIFADRLDYAGTLVAVLAPEADDRPSAPIVSHSDETVATPPAIVAAPVAAPAYTVIAAVEDQPATTESSPGTTASPVTAGEATEAPEVHKNATRPDASNTGAVVAGWLGTQGKILDDGLSKQAAPLETAALPKREGTGMPRARPQAAGRAKVLRSPSNPDDAKPPLSARVIIEPPKDGGCVWLLHNGDARLFCS